MICHVVPCLFELCIFFVRSTIFRVAKMVYFSVPHESTGKYGIMSLSLRHCLILYFSAKTILKNNPIPPDHQKGVKYFWECQKFTLAAKRLLDVLRVKIRLIRNIEVYHVKLANAWGIFILILILLIIPFLVFMARNVIWTFQVNRNCSDLEIPFIWSIFTAFCKQPRV